MKALAEQLKQGDKSLVGNKGYRKYLKVVGEEHFEIDVEKATSDERFDGSRVLQTDMDLPAEQVALKYKELWMVESIFRAMKSILETRPISQARRDHPRPCLLQLPGTHAHEGVAAPHGGSRVEAGMAKVEGRSGCAPGDQRRQWQWHVHGAHHHPGRRRQGSAGIRSRALGPSVRRVVQETP